MAGGISRASVLSLVVLVCAAQTVPAEAVAIHRPTSAGAGAVIHVQLSGAVSLSGTFSGSDTICELATFPAKNGTPTSQTLSIAANATGVVVRPPAKDAFALELEYMPHAISYTSRVLLSVVLHYHSYLYGFGSTSIAAHTADGARSGTFVAVGLKPNNGTGGGHVNARGSWTCAGFYKTTINL